MKKKKSSKESRQCKHENRTHLSAGNGFKCDDCGAIVHESQQPQQAGGRTDAPSQPQPSGLATVNHIAGRKLTETEKQREARKLLEDAEAAVTAISGEIVALSDSVVNFRNSFYTKLYDVMKRHNAEFGTIRRFLAHKKEGQKVFGLYKAGKELADAKFGGITYGHLCDVHNAVNGKGRKVKGKDAPPLRPEDLNFKLITVSATKTDGDDDAGDNHEKADGNDGVNVAAKATPPTPPSECRDEGGTDAGGNPLAPPHKRPVSDPLASTSVTALKVDIEDENGTVHTSLKVDAYHGKTLHYSGTYSLLTPSLWSQALVHIIKEIVPVHVQDSFSRDDVLKQVIQAAQDQLGVDIPAEAVPEGNLYVVLNPAEEGTAVA